METELPTKEKTTSLPKDTTPPAPVEPTKGEALYEKVSIYVEYIHGEFLKKIADICRSSMLPKHLWFRVVEQMVINYGMLEAKGIFVQEELSVDKASGSYVRNGVGQVVLDYLDSLDEQGVETDEGKAKFTTKYDDTPIGYDATQGDVERIRLDEEVDIDPGAEGDGESGDAVGEKPDVKSEGGAVRKGVSKGKGRVKRDAGAGSPEKGGPGAVKDCKKTVRPKEKCND